MSLRTLSLATMMTVMMLASPFVNVVSADGTAQAPSSYAYLPSWAGDITGDLEQIGENYLGHTFSKHDFDEENNMYFVSSEDYGDWMNSEYVFSNSRGFHLLKITPEGSVEYAETVSCSTYCNYPDYAYSKVVGVHTVAEDQLFVTFSVYNTQVSFGSNSQYYSSNNLITAFFNNGTWDWVESESTSGYAYSSLVYQGLDDNDNLYTVLKGPSTSGWSEYSISSTSTAGTNWVRSLEVPYQSPQNNNLPPLFDVNESGLHIFATVKSTIKYDSQSTSCPLGGEEGFCHMWLKINTNGVKQSMSSSLYSSLSFSMMMVENDSMYLTGSTYDFVSGSNTESNFTGQKISHSPRYAQYLAVMDKDGGWDGHLVVNEQAESTSLYPFIVDVMDDGNVIFSDWYYSQTSVDGEIINEYSDAALEYIISKIDLNTGIVWSANVGFDNANSLPTRSLSDGNTTAFLLTHPSNNGFAKYQYQGAEVSSPTGSNNSEILWVDLENGDIIDVESTTATSVDGRSNDGGVIASQSNFMFYFMPDFDGDNIGSNDNCPNIFNPTQSDYNNNGDGDACDPDDDSDGIMDGSDSCPRGVLDWTSESITDHDGDGCKDSTDEDLDDDNDGQPDSTDACPLGIEGASYDLDGDGCKDVEDDDDDGDLIRDESDLCSMGVIDWSSGTLTDHDADGCLDDDDEDSDDDNDGIADSVDACPRGAVGWPSNLNTDFDNDGCRDGYEDEDDDGDGIPNSIDNCPQSIGIVNAQGCTATQLLDDENGGSSLVYYVCPVGSVVVLDPTDCPVDNSNTNTSQSNNDSAGEDTAFYYVCPGGTDVVEDLSECSELIGTGGTNVTLVVDPNSNESSDYSTCPDGRAIVLDLKDCPNSGSNDDIASSSDSDSNDMMLFFMGGTFVMSTIAMIAIFIRRPQVQESDFSSKVHSTNYMFKEEPEIPALSSPQPTPPTMLTKKTSSSTPSAELIGQAHNGKEWVEWPDNSGNHWYREVGFGGEWSKYDN